MRITGIANFSRNQSGVSNVRFTCHENLLVAKQKNKSYNKNKTFFPAIYYKSKKAIQVLFLIWF